MTGAPRVTSIRVHRLRAPLKQRFGWSLNWATERRATLVEVRTGAGLTGWGDGGWGGERLLAARERVLGRSVFEVEAIHEELRAPGGHQERRGPNMAGGLDTALWDLCGQALGVPVSRILGKVHRDRVTPYCTALYRKDWPDLGAGLAAEAVEWQERGFRSMKMKIGYGPQLDLRIVREVRRALGEETGLAVDSNCAYDAPAALALGARLEDCNLLWWEEPLLADDVEGYARLKAQLRIPLAGGETFDEDRLMKLYVQPRLVDIVQPEVEIAGLTGAKRLSAACWLNRIRLIPHNWGTAVRTAAILHWAATIAPLTEAPGGPEVMFEFDQTESPFRDAVVRNPIALESDGRVAVPQGSGLGVQVREDEVARYREELIVIEP